MSGVELRQRREAAGVKAFQLASEMRPPVHSSRVSQIESLATVTEAAAARYLDALDRCLVAKTASAQ